MIRITISTITRTTNTAITIASIITTTNVLIVIIHHTSVRIIPRTASIILGGCPCLSASARANIMFRNICGHLIVSQKKARVPSLPEEQFGCMLITLLIVPSLLLLLLL